MANSDPLNKRIRLKIEHEYHQEPVISHAVGGGWFDLDLQGTETQIQDGLTYLRNLELEIWDENRVGQW
jgi:hypothetical protein